MPYNPTKKDIKITYKLVLVPLVLSPDGLEYLNSFALDLVKVRVTRSFIVTYYCSVIVASVLWSIVSIWSVMSIKLAVHTFSNIHYLFCLLILMTSFSNASTGAVGNDRLSMNREKI